MKLIISESQNLTIERFNIFKRVIEKLLSKYDWYENFEIEISPYEFQDRNGFHEVPEYKVVVTVIESFVRKYSYSKFNDDLNHLHDEIDTLFELTYPVDENGSPIVVWDMSIKYK